MNTPVSDGAAGSSVVTSVETGIPSVGDYLTDTAQGAFTIITVTVTNTSNHSIDFNASEQHAAVPIVNTRLPIPNPARRQQISCTSSHCHVLRTDEICHLGCRSDRVDARQCPQIMGFVRGHREGLLKLFSGT